MKARRKPYKGMAMEGGIARRYARETGGDLSHFRELAARLGKDLKTGARILEVAPGPGYLAIELWKLGGFSVTGLDISRSFVAIARQNAHAQGAAVEFTEGNVSEMAFADESFDFIVCRAAFKNFGAPAEALSEMHRVLAPGGEALVIDMRREATNRDIAREVRAMNLPTWTSRFVTRLIFRYGLRPRAYRAEDFRKLVAASPFGSCLLDQSGLGFEARMRRAQVRRLAAA
jgi:ubiquinone/menaquinone biosynthesis C-methylase UbiE